MVEDAKAREDGPAFEPTNRLRGLAAVEAFVVIVGEALAMSENEKVVGNFNSLSWFGEQYPGQCSSTPGATVNVDLHTRVEQPRATEADSPLNQIKHRIKVTCQKLECSRLIHEHVHKEGWLQGVLGGTWSARITVTLAEPEFAMARGPARHTLTANFPN